MELRIGVELELTKDLDCVIRVIPKGEIFEVEYIAENRISIINKSLGVGVFNIEEINEYFKEYIEKVEVNDNVERVIYSGRVTVVILKDGSKGVSKCLESDTYSKKDGYNIAYLKANIKSMTKQLNKYYKQ